jgi:hypothetical protein
MQTRERAAQCVCGGAQKEAGEDGWDMHGQCRAVGAQLGCAVGSTPQPVHFDHSQHKPGHP